MAESITSGSFIYLKHASGDYVTSISRGTTRRYNWPTLGDKVDDIYLQVLRLSEGLHGKTPADTEPLQSGDSVQFRTAEPRAGNRNTLGAFIDSHSCYYWDDGHDDREQGWIITKADGSTGSIGYGDRIVITNIAYAGQRLAADNRYQGYITTSREVSDSWSFEKRPSRAKGDYEWSAYYDKFSYFQQKTVRAACHPRIREKAEHTKAIVLVHGLTDSPYYMSAIADYFFTELHYNVYLPLLQGHGLVIPNGMEGVSLEEWQKNVEFAIDTAIGSPDAPREVSIGGLSTGGTLSCYMAAKQDSKITGALYLFSAALDIAGSAGTGDLKEYLLRTFMTDVLDYRDADSPLIGKNPYRYARMDKDGARELSRQIYEIDQLIKNYSPKNPFQKPVFAAHSESDFTADIGGIESFRDISDLDKFRFFRIYRQHEVSHASLVLKTAVELVSKTSSKVHKNHVYYKLMTVIFNQLEGTVARLRSVALQEPLIERTCEDPILEKENPLFDQMMEAIKAFEATLSSPNQAEPFQISALRERLQNLPIMDESKTHSVLEFHQKTLADPKALSRYATIAKATYFDLSSFDGLQDASALLKSVDCKLIEASVDLKDVWLLNGLQAMCVSRCSPDSGDQLDELIVAYRGTNITNPADVIVDGGVGSNLLSGIGDNVVRNIIRSEMGDSKTQQTFIEISKWTTLAGQLAGRLVNAMTYYQRQVNSLQPTFDRYRKITVVGHSLGGLIAAHVAYWANQEYARTVYCHTFNAAPGVKYTLMDKEEDCNPTIANRIINHRIIGDSVSSPPLPGSSLKGTDAEGFPYAHMGYIYNWRPLEKDSFGNIDVHSLSQFIDELKCDPQHLEGIAPAPFTNLYW